MAQHRPQPMAQATRQGLGFGLGLREVCPCSVRSTPVSVRQDKGAKHAV